MASGGPAPPSVRPSRFRVPAHVAAYSLFLLPAVAFWLYYEKNAPTDEELAEKLKQHGYHQDEKATQRSKDMQQFFRKTVFTERPDEKTEAQLQELLKGGVGDMTRQAAVDDKLYGTAQGVKEKERTTAKLEQEKAERAKRRKQRPKQPTGGETKSNKKDEVAKQSKNVKEVSSASPSAAAKPQNTAQVAALVIAVGSVAAIVGFFAGSSGSSRGR